MSESTLVKMPHCWKSHVAAHMFMISDLFRKDGSTRYICGPLAVVYVLGHPIVKLHPRLLLYV